MKYTEPSFQQIGALGGTVADDIRHLCGCLAGELMTPAFNAGNHKFRMEMRNLVRKHFGRHKCLPENLFSEIQHTRIPPANPRCIDECFVDKKVFPFQPSPKDRRSKLPKDQKGGFTVFAKLLLFKYSGLCFLDIAESLVGYSGNEYFISTKLGERGWFFPVPVIETLIKERTDDLLELAKQASCLLFVQGVTGLAQVVVLTKLKSGRLAVEFCSLTDVVDQGIVFIPGNHEDRSPWYP